MLDQLSEKRHFCHIAPWDAMERYMVEAYSLLLLRLLPWFVWNMTSSNSKLAPKWRQLQISSTNCSNPITQSNKTIKSLNELELRENRYISYTITIVAPIGRLLSSLHLQSRPTVSLPLVNCLSTHIHIFWRRLISSIVKISSFCVTFHLLFYSLFCFILILKLSVGYNV